LNGFFLSLFRSLFIFEVTTMFAPIAIAFRQLMGDARFIKVRGQAIALHAQAITRFCDQFGIERSQRQNWIRLARDNGKRLGLLA
jgi:hypothetical protein